MTDLGGTGSTAGERVEPGGAGPEEDPPAFGARIVDLLVGGIILLFGAVVMFDSHRLGNGWADDGPQSGYFPFYIGLFVVLSSAATLVEAWLKHGPDEAFVGRGQLKLVFAVLVPSFFYIAVIQFAGMYAASAVFIGFFMRWLGKYSWTKVVVVSIAVTVAFYLMFEEWFLVPLPKGPLENLLGLG
jgi:hypothetical protein